MDEKCPCGSTELYSSCCGQLHSGEKIAHSAEALMRSRYSAFVKNEISYLKDTTWPAQQKKFSQSEHLDRAINSLWMGLTVHASDAGTQSDTRGTVRFTAKSMIHGKINEHSENSLFKKKNGKWYYVKPIE